MTSLLYKRKICVVTGTRADYGLLFHTLKALQSDKDIELQLVVTGMHLSPEFGLTYRQIEADGFHIDRKVEILLSSDTQNGISKSIGLGIIGLSDAFSELKPDILLVLGDRFEIFAACSAATIHCIPIAHCHGGETTQGVFDEAFRHSITKMSHIHFASTQLYKKRIEQLGESPNRVFVSGALGLEYIQKMAFLTKENLSHSLNFDLGKQFFLICYHPVTLENSTAEFQIKSILAALDSFPDVKYVFTKANADTDGRIVNQLINSFCNENPKRSRCFSSLGQQKFLSVLKYADLFIGNSSSGILEAPSVQTGSVNIGDRQKGRIQARSVMNCKPNTEDIVRVIKMGMQSDFVKKLNFVENPYECQNSSHQILETLKHIDLSKLLKKEFYDLS